jgi:hypothetical protein
MERPVWERSMTRRWCFRNSVCSLCAPRLLSPQPWAGMLPLVAAHRQPASNELLAFRCEKHRLDTPAKSASTDGTVTQAEITTELAGPYCASKGRRNSALPNIIGEVSPLVKVPGIELNRWESGWWQDDKEGWQSASGVSGLSLFSLLSTKSDVRAGVRRVWLLPFGPSHRSRSSDRRFRE